MLPCHLQQNRSPRQTTRKATRKTTLTSVQTTEQDCGYSVHYRLWFKIKNFREFSNIFKTASWHMINIDIPTGNNEDKK
jgi:hypothetical protein